MNQNEFSHDELMKICDDMIRFGGSFSASLAKCFMNADNTNKRRLIEAFPEFFQKKK